ncbi:hypothetical protein SDC9_187583 [bioreactor metagenome]|uniref:Uncharacterized protein n=1 Tax=bioreactor metagenome TaxID=1076179 RepID=A0A645HLY8_9ZZZZ
MSAPLAVSGEKVQVIPRHIDALHILRQTISDHGAGNSPQFEFRLCLRNLGKGLVRPVLHRNRAGLYSREFSPDADRRKKIPVGRHPVDERA